MLSCFGATKLAKTPINTSTDKSAYSLGEPVKMLVKYTNISSEAISNYYLSGQKFDFIVKDQNKKEVWRWSRGKMFIMSIQPFHLEPGKSVSYSYSWSQKDISGKPVRAGKYYLIGEITLAPRIRSQEKAFTIK